MRKFVLIFGLLFLTACASATDTKSVNSGVNDPMEGLNRAMFEANYFLDGLILKPVAALYRDLPPPAVRESMDNFLINLGEPLNFINHSLQANVSGAANTLFRFVVNSTIGLLGAFDVATAWFNTPTQREDFGQTLAYWGVGDGPYAMLPILGPSNTRDTVGKVADYFMDPFRYVVDVRNREEELARARGITDGVSGRASVLAVTDDLEKNSVDYYAAIRSLYKQRRDFLIQNKDADRAQKMPSSADTVKKQRRSDVPGGLELNLSGGQIMTDKELPVRPIVSVQ